MRSQTQRSTEAGKKKKKGQGPRLSAFPEPGKGQGSGSGTRRGLLGSPELYLVPEGHSRAESPERNPPTRAAPDAPREASFGGSWAGPWPLHAGAPNRAARGQAVERPALGGKGGGADSHEVSMDALLRRPLSAEAPADPTLSGPPSSLEGHFLTWSVSGDST